jgi:hypothetical protein
MEEIKKIIKEHIAKRANRNFFETILTRRTPAKKLSKTSKRL